MLKDWAIEDYLFGESAADLDEQRKETIRQQLRREMMEIFYGRNLDPEQLV